MRFMDISKVVTHTGIPASTLRFYEKKGLIQTISPAGERRHFAPEVLDQLALIALGQAGGLSLDEIHAMLSPSGTPQVDRNLLLAKADEIDATIKRLRAMSKGLRHVAECSAPSHTQCPKFQHLLQVAAKSKLKQAKVILSNSKTEKEYAK